MAYHHKVRSTIHMGIVIFPTSPWGKLHYSVIPRVSSQWAFSAINVSMILLVCPSPWYLSWVVERLKIREPFVWKLELVLRQELHSNSGKTELSLTFYLPVDSTGVELPATVCVFFYEVLLISVVSGVLPKNILPSANCWLAVLWKCTRTPWQTCCRPRLSRIICSTWETLLVWSKVLSSPPLTLLKILITSSDSGAMRYAIFNPKWYIVIKWREWFSDHDSGTCESWKTQERPWSKLNMVWLD